MTFDFQEALSYMKAGFTVSLNLGTINRLYRIKGNDIICLSNGNEHLAYTLTYFYVDTIMSDNWKLVE